MAKMKSPKDDFAEEVSAAALAQLAEWRDEGRADRLSATALDASVRPGRRWFAARHLAAFDDRETIDSLSRLLSDPDARLRQQAARSLREIGPSGDAAVPALLVALFDGEGPVRVAATRALGAIGDQSAVPELVRVAETTPWDTLHSWATDSLVRLGAPEGNAQLIRRLEAGKAWQRRWAAEKLGEVGSSDALGALREARKRDPLHRRTYTQALRRIERRTAQGVGVK